jgi:hypothetical protein
MLFKRISCYKAMPQLKQLITNLSPPMPEFDPGPVHDQRSALMFIYILLLSEGQTDKT